MPSPNDVGWIALQRASYAHTPLQSAIGSGSTSEIAGELQKLYEKWITPYGGPIEGELDALFKIEAIAE